MSKESLYTSISKAMGVETLLFRDDVQEVLCFEAFSLEPNFELIKSVQLWHVLLFSHFII